jgi:hypothetical protein
MKNKNKIYSIVEHICSKPLLYLPSASVEIIEVFINGYLFALRENQISENELFFKHFPDWLKLTYNCYHPRGWALAISVSVEDNAKAIELLLKYIREYSSCEVEFRKEISKIAITDDFFESFNYISHENNDSNTSISLKIYEFKNVKYSYYKFENKEQMIYCSELFKSLRISTEHIRLRHGIDVAGL